MLKIVGGFKDQEKRLAIMESQVRYCGEVLSWMAECFAQSTLKCGKEAPRAPMSVMSYKADEPQNQPEKEVKEKEGGTRSGHHGYGTSKKYPYIDE